ncbi:MAG: TonB-dependent receptor [Bryobacterales bacterium]
MQNRIIKIGALGLIAAFAMFAQSQGTIQGVVTDDSGAVIPGATVTVSNDATGVDVIRSTNEVGFYTAPGLNPGDYTVSVTADGFSTAQRPGVRLEVAQTLRLDIQLSVGQLTEVVEVSAAAQLIQSEKTEVGQVIDSKRILEMPLNGRNYLELARFSVGVLPSRSLGKGTRQDGERGGEGGTMAVGMAAAQTNVLVDGADNSSRNSGGALGFQAQSTKPAIDSVGEFKVVTNNNSAEYGYRMGAKVIVSTKSGTNQFHGSAYEFLRNDKLDGTNFFANAQGAAKPTLRRNQFGATIGGPIVKNKMFFFVSWQSTFERLGQSFTSTVPTLAARNGDFSGEPDPNRLIYDPLTNPGGQREEFPNYVIPASRFDPVSKTIVDLYPNPTNGKTRNNYFYSPSDKVNFHQYDFKWDYNINDNHRTFIRYSLRDENVLNNCPMPLPACGGTGQTVDLPGQNWAASLQSTFGSRMFNELRFGYTHFPTRFDIPFTENLNSQYGIKGAPGDTIGDGLDQGYSLFIPGSGFTNVGPRAFWPNVNKLDNIQISDNFTIIQGRHTIKFGYEFRRSDVPRSPSRYRRGQFNFNGQYTAGNPTNSGSRGQTGSGLADMLLGFANNETWGFPNGEDVITPYHGMFVQDDWKITNRLTLNVGVRYERFMPPTFPDPSKQTVSRFLTQINGRAFDPGEGIVPGAGGWGEAQYLPQFVVPSSSSDSGGKTDGNNFAPRFGIAYRATSKTVIRAGAGLYYGEANNVQGEQARFFTGAPLANEFNNPQPFNRLSQLIVQEGFAPVTPEGFPRAGLSVSTSADGAWPQLYSGQWFFDIQHELPLDTLLTIGYNGTSTSQMPVGVNINRPVTFGDGSVNVNNRRVRPFFNSVNMIGVQYMNANYNSLTVKGEKRFTNGFTFLSSFTWSHNIDYGNENLFQGATAQERYTYNKSIERASASLDRRLAYVLSAVYELPFGKGKSFLQSGPGNWILGGWQVGGILSLLAGTPDSHSFNRDTTGVGGANRGNLVGELNLPRSERTVERWFNVDGCRPLTSACAVQPGNTFALDNAGRNLIIGPPSRNFDFSLSRRFTITEKQALQFRFESFNFTNTPTFGSPNTAIGGANAGIITTASDPRRIQFGLKYMF